MKASITVDIDAPSMTALLTFQWVVIMLSGRGVVGTGHRG